MFEIAEDSFQCQQSDSSPVHHLTQSPGLAPASENQFAVTQGTLQQLCGGTHKTGHTGPGGLSDNLGKSTWSHTQAA